MSLPGSKRSVATHIAKDAMLSLFLPVQDSANIEDGSHIAKGIETDFRGSHQWRQAD
jgi:hypothetical protein